MIVGAKRGTQLHTNRFNEIDFLRALACVMVVLFHYTYRGHVGGWVPVAAPEFVQSISQFGYVGVHLFFAISGFVIFMSAKSASPRGFVASRAARLYPAYWASIIITVMAVRLGNMPELTVSWRDAAINVTMLTHLLGASYVDGAYWSLAVELHFYALIFVLIRLNWLHRIEWVMALWLALCAIDLVRPIYPLQFWLIANWAPFFCLGITSYLLRTEPVTQKRIALFVIAALLCIISGVKKTLNSPITDQIIVGLLMTCIVGIFTLISLGRFRLQASPILYWAGALTYPIYLIHEYLGYTLLTTTQNASWPYGLSLAATLSVILLISYFVHTKIERVYATKLRRIIQGG